MTGEHEAACEHLLASLAVRHESGGSVVSSGTSCSMCSSLICKDKVNISMSLTLRN